MNHRHARRLALDARARGRSTSRCCQWMLSARRRAKSSVPAATVALVWRSIRMKAPSSRQSRIRLERDRLVQAEVAVAHLVELQPLGGQLLLGVHVDLVLDLGDLRADRARADLQPVAATRQQRALRPSTAGARRTGRRPAAGCAAAAITSPRLMSRSSSSVSVTASPCTARLQVAVGGDDARHPRARAARQHHHLVAGRERAGHHLARRSHGSSGPAGTPTAPACGSPARWPGARSSHGLQMLEQARAARTRRSSVERLADVVAAQRRQRDRR